MKQQPRSARTTWVKHHRGRNFAIIAFVTAILIILIVAFSATPPAPTGTQIGQQAPDFSLTDINNANFRLSDKKGTPILLEFMTTSCHYCTEQAPILSQLYTSHTGHVAFVSISIDPTTDQPSLLANYAQTHNMPWTWLRDTSGVKQTYGVTGTPTTFLLDSDGIVKNKFIGLTGLQALDSACLALS